MGCRSNSTDVDVLELSCSGSLLSASRFDTRDDVLVVDADDDCCWTTELVDGFAVQPAVVAVAAYDVVTSLSLADEMIRLCMCQANYNASVKRSCASSSFLVILSKYCGRCVTIIRHVGQDDITAKYL